METESQVMPYGGGTAGVLALAPATTPWRRGTFPPPSGSLPLNNSTLCIYRDSIRKVSVSGVLCRSGEGPYDYCWSSAASSASLDASSDRCSSVSFSSDGDFCSFSGWGAAAPDGGDDDELRAIAQQMVCDGYMKSLIRGFSAGGASSSTSSWERYGCLGLGLGPDPGASREELLLLSSWFTELDVEWVLHTGHLEDDGCASLHDLMERWIKAFKTMVQVLCITQLDLRSSNKPDAGGVHAAEREQEVAQFTRFAKVSLLRMLGFVDAVADAATNDDHRSPEMLPGIWKVYTCVVDDWPAVLALFNEASSTTSTPLFDAMNDVFLRRKRNKLRDAIWSMMEDVRASFLTDHCWRLSLTEAGGVHKATMRMVNYIMLLSRNEGVLNCLLDHSYSALNLIRDLISCLETQLEKTSNLISDPGLRYVFLMNNCSFISKKVSSLLLPPWTPMEDYKVERSRKRDYRGSLPPMQEYVNQPDPNLRAKIETDSNLYGLVKIQSFIEAYLDASWEPVMSCLYHHGIPRGFLRCGSALDNFESPFWKTYATQKLWKVPNPELRKRLRKAIIEKVISGYNRYLAEQTAKWKSFRQPNNTPLELEQLIEELLEG